MAQQKLMKQAPADAFPAVQNPLSRAMAPCCTVAEKSHILSPAEHLALCLTYAIILGLLSRIFPFPRKVITKIFGAQDTEKLFYPLLPAIVMDETARTIRAGAGVNLQRKENRLMSFLGGCQGSPSSRSSNRNVEPGVYFNSNTSRKGRLLCNFHGISHASRFSILLHGAFILVSNAGVTFIFYID